MREEMEEMEERIEEMNEVSEEEAVVEEEKKGEEVAAEKERVPVIEFDITRDSLLEFVNLARAGGLLDEIAFSVSEKGIVAVNVDPASVLLTAVVLPADFLLEVPRAKRENLWIEANRVITLLSAVKESDIHVKITKEKFEVRSETKKIVAPLLARESKKDVSKLIEVADDLKITPKFSYDYEYDVKVSELLNALMIKDANIVFQCYDNGVSVTQYDVEGEYEAMTLFKYAGDEEKAECKVILSYEYLRKILSVCDKNNYIMCKFSKEVQPALLQYASPNGCDAVFLIAPRIEEEY
ncbi:hypothetical protein DRO49_02480 [Candidatus Bathyarchaeota archaeon]|nr:MAG: hypothetical protein DRO49_02480 [Candidatus Bathyarchaeota archaeon]